jgi:hypothetical protein
MFLTVKDANLIFGDPVKDICPGARLLLGQIKNAKYTAI